MILTINDNLRINSDPLNWIVEKRKPSRWEGIAFFRHLHNAVNALKTETRYAGPPTHPADLRDVARVAERLEAVQQRLLKAFATPLSRRELAGLGIAVEAAGYRFDLSDPLSVHRQVPRKRGWESKQYYSNLGMAMTSTLRRMVRSSEEEGAGAAIQTIHQVEIALMAACRSLPAASFGAATSSAFPRFPVLPSQLAIPLGIAGTQRLANRGKPMDQAGKHNTSSKPVRGWRPRLAWSVFALGAVLGASPAAAQQGPEHPPKKPFPAVRLPKHLQGEEAIRGLGAQLSAVAAWYGKDAAEFARELRTDKRAWLDREGRLLFIDDFPTPANADAAAADATSASGAPLPADQTFLLHSRPGAKRVIYLDFLGQVVTGTAWNNSYSLAAIDARPFDLDGVPSSSSAAELERIQYIWQRVAEDYGRFDVDVTTEEPPADAITRSSSSDQYFGTRVLITQDWTAVTASPCGCGGIAYVGSFDDTTDGYKPAWVFFNQLGAGNEKYVAEAISHEAGHNLGLSHDGTSTTGYYAGHGSGATGWAPIMGVGYYKELTQWSKGEYPGANQTQADLQIIQNTGGPLRPDDHGDTAAAATPLDPLASANPVDTLEAGISLTTTAAGTYYLFVDGTGKGDLSTGYSDYGSLGEYTITGTVPAPGGQAPVAKASANPVSGPAPLAVSFTGANSYDPDGGALRYDWDFGDGSAHSTAPNPSHSYAAGSYTAILRVADPSGASASTQVNVTASAPPGDDARLQHRHGLDHQTRRGPVPGNGDGGGRQRPGCARRDDRRHLERDRFRDRKQHYRQQRQRDLHLGLDQENRNPDLQRHRRDRGGL